MARSSTSLMVAIALCALCAAVAAADSRRGLRAAQTGYGYEGKEYHDEQQHEGYGYKDEHEGHEGYGHEGHGYHHHTDRTYEGHHKAKQFLLQESNFQCTSDEHCTVEFRCGRDSDEPDSCLHQEDDYNKYKHEHEHTFDTIISNDYAATCRLVSEAAGEGSCPHFIDAHATCIRSNMSCTISKRAETCGCPFTNGAMFDAEGYIMLTNVHSCDSGNDTISRNSQRKFQGRRGRTLAAADGYGYEHDNVTLNAGESMIFTGHIVQGLAKDGYSTKHLHGKVRYVLTFETDATRRQRLAQLIKKKSAKAKKQNVQAGVADSEYYGEEEEEDDYYAQPYQGSAPLGLVKEGNMHITLLESSEYY